MQNSLFDLQNHYARLDGNKRKSALPAQCTTAIWRWVPTHRGSESKHSTRQIAEVLKRIARDSKR